jgi:4-hydroxy-4-methyl-2-oxoglutarate aldolase
MSKTLELLANLARYDTPTICNTIEVFDVRPRTQGYMDHRIRSAFPELGPIVGFATTATFRSAWPAQGGDVYANLGKQLTEFETLPGPAIVVFQDLDDPPVGATFGEVMCSLYQAFGAVGLITSGGGRDLAQVSALRFPVFLGATICSHGYSQTVDVGQPVRVGGLQVRPGDLLHGDANGVTNIPIEIADEVAEVAQEYVAAEKLVIDYAQAEGPKTIATMMELRRAMGEAIGVLKRRVSRQRR